MSLRDTIATIVFRTLTWMLRRLRYLRHGLRSYHSYLPLREFSAPGRQVFFGYYDVTPFNYDETLLLAAAAPPENRPTGPEDLLQLGTVSLTEDHPQLKVVAETKAWCWQQSCRYQWFPPREYGRNYQAIFNDYDAENRRYVSRVIDVRDGTELCRYNHPVYALDHAGRYAFTLNFARLGRLRPGYGYVNQPDTSAGYLAPADDGLLRLDLDTGATRLLFSLHDLTGIQPLPDMDGAEHYLNHISVNPYSKTLLFFHIWVRGSKRKTRLFVCDLDGGDVRIPIQHGGVAHYAWKNADELLCYSRHTDGDDSTPRYHLYNLRSGDYSVVGRDVLPHDGHPTYFPGSRYILTDTYPDLASHQNLLLYDTATNTARTLGTFDSSRRFRDDVKCDLHPRLSPRGRRICIDSAHSGRRRLYVLEIGDPTEIL